MAKMKAAVYYGPGDIRVEQVERPTAGDVGAVVKVGAVGICPLIDVPHYKMSYPLQDIPAGYYEKPVKNSGIILGHEYAGEVVEVGKKVTALKKGDRVYAVIWGPCGKCDNCKKGDYEHCAFGDGGGRVTPGAMAEYMLLPDMTYPQITDDKIVKLPDKLTYRDGALIELLRLGIGLASKTKPGDIVAHFGMDMIGLASVLDLKAKGCKVIACDIDDKKLQAARDMGADVVINSRKEDVTRAFMKATGGKFADIVLESSCLSENLQNAVNVVAPNGHVWIASFYTEGAFFNPSYVHPNMVSANLCQKGGVALHCPWGTLGPWKPMLERAIQMMVSGKITAAKYVDHVYPLDKVNEAFQVACNPYGAMKVMLEP